MFKIIEMSNEAIEIPLATRPRLKFIDMGRSLAILMMLEGHFTGASLANEYRKDEYWLYDFWHNLHGLTSPLFFAITGVVFVYLLSKNTEIPFFENERVRKGFKRVRMLLFWGYLIQLDLITLIRDTYYGFKDMDEGGGRGFVYHLDWLQAFHVLQSIGIGIFLLLTVFSVFKLIKKGPLYLYYLIVALIIFVIYGYLKEHIRYQDYLVETGKITLSERAFIPSWAPQFIQNMIYGKFSDFSFLRYSGYVLMGGMIGALIRKQEHNVRKWWFATTFFAVGLFFNLYGQTLFTQIDWLVESLGVTSSCFENNTTGFARLGQVAMLLGILMIIDSKFNVKAPLFLKVGQNTFPIYIVHVIILYGGILGYGLKSTEWFDENLGPWFAISISAFFIFVFIVMVKYIEPLTELYYKVFGIFYPKRKR